MVAALSVDIYVTTGSARACPKCGHETAIEPRTIADGNVTYNMGRAFREALGSVGVDGDYMALGGLRGRPMAEVVDLVTRAQAYVDANREALRRFEPDNKWGSVECLDRIFGMLLRACSDPDAREIEVSG